MLSFLVGIVVTNDGNAILRELDIAHPAAKVVMLNDFTQSIYDWTLLFSFFFVLQPLVWYLFYSDTDFIVDFT